MITLMAYNPSWDTDFHKEKDSLFNLGITNIIKIEHIGSTAINGMFAKPVIDILIGVNDLNTFTSADIQRIESLGYRQVMQGQVADLGGGVFKKRLNETKHRSIILAKGGHYWVYEFLFAKNDLNNISDEELVEFRRLVKAYSELSEKQIEQLLKNKDLVEICDECKI